MHIIKFSTAADATVLYLSALSRVIQQQQQVSFSAFPIKSHRRRQRRFIIAVLLAAESCLKFNFIHKRERECREKSIQYGKFS